MTDVIILLTSPQEEREIDLVSYVNRARPTFSFMINLKTYFGGLLRQQWYLEFSYILRNL